MAKKAKNLNEIQMEELVHELLKLLDDIVSLSSDGQKYYLNGLKKGIALGSYLKELSIEIIKK